MVIEADYLTKNSPASGGADFAEVPNGGSRPVGFNPQTGHPCDPASPAARLYLLQYLEIWGRQEP